jgi:dihydrofolate reductase
MARLFFGMNQSLDGYVDHLRFPAGPGPRLFRAFIDHTAGLAGSLYGRKLYEAMRYWDEDQPGWDDAQRDFAEAWRAVPKYVVSRSLAEAGPNATLLGGDLRAAVSRLKAETEGEIEVGGPMLAGSLTGWGLIDEYRIYLHPVVLGSGTPFFAASRPPLRLTAVDRFDGDVLRLVYVPV